ncbi:MAG: hypothetical protein U0S50_03090 [Sphingopyxis sp.]|uniref:hypothetical protein n=1 Tax=Sphingopyxis sp. TaxID=1908224 RepID=UPI002ABB6DFD|nr:hypothetical protein [Sphingopyxis sp.]MDZ3830788.1 hypothetical protein [Sphingopyxis sp.]
MARPPLGGSFRHRDGFHGGYAGYFADPDGHLWEIAFADPDGHLWEIAWNPQMLPVD